MHVRICGPNLSSAAQRRGSMHVHAADCQDLKKYGPGKPMGGDVSGVHEMMVEATSCIGVIMEIYPDQIGEAIRDDQTREDVAADYLSDTYFAPCCNSLPVDPPLSPVYECWVSGQVNSFTKLTSTSDVINWLRQQFNVGLPKHAPVSIVLHDASEYTS